jgi:ankyrin repeat protein
MLAALNGNIRIVKSLLQYGANVDMSGLRNRKTPLTVRVAAPNCSAQAMRPSQRTCTIAIQFAPSPHCNLPISLTTEQLLVQINVRSFKLIYI